jgi:hypothetical protein
MINKSCISTLSLSTAWVHLVLQGKFVNKTKMGYLESKS